MKYIFIVLYILCSECLSAQMYELGNQSKWNYLTNFDVSCYFQLLKNDQYSISFSVVHKDVADIVYSLFISYGTVHKKGNIYCLKDLFSGAEIILEQVKHSNLIVRKGFSFMENEYLFFYREADDLTDSFLENIAGEIKGKSERELIYQKEKSNKVVPLRLGGYKNRDVSLFLDLEYRYQIHYSIEGCSFLISEGQWSKKGNELTLFDPILNHSFLALINPNGLSMIRFPNNLNPTWNYSPVENEMHPFIMR